METLGCPVSGSYDRLGYRGIMSVLWPPGQAALYMYIWHQRALSEVATHSDMTLDVARM